MMSELHSSSEERDIRAALQYAVAQICTEEEMSDTSTTHMSSQAVAALSELVFQYSTQCLSNDLVAFARHASRRTVTLDDVQLVARKDPEGLQAKLASFAKRENLTSGRRECAKSNNSPQSSNNATTTPMTQRIRALAERLKKGIDSSEDDSATDTDEEMKKEAQTNKEIVPFAYTVDDDLDDDDLGKGKENQKMQPVNMSKTEEDPFASSEDEKEAARLGKKRKNATVAKFPPAGAKTDLSSDESEENVFE